ncbi:MAG: hypothetical protein AAGC56_10515 [Pseudomonadota bacterium]
MIDMPSPQWLRIGYAANIIILVPVCYAMVFGAGVSTVFEGNVPESEGLRLLVASFWFAILLASIAGLVSPAFFAPILIVQIVYKSAWLATYVAPRLLTDGVGAVPMGVAITFGAIVLTYPLILRLASR